MACAIRCSRGQKICCGVTAIVVILLLVTSVILFLTVLKPKNPIIIIQPVKLERFDSAVSFPDLEFELNLTLGVVATVKNPNHASFTYQNSTATLSYRGNLVGEAPVNGDTVPDHGELNVSTPLVVHLADKLLNGGNIVQDFNNGVVNFISATTLQGRVKILKIFKKKATSFSTCHIYVFTKNQTIYSTCQNKVEF
ncbi:hypothetical protein QN277_001248 [Acacia crassicarpa]|uniref:Late embryogenesis abundant protein LEA-2 subgroup domain-containing protein n=1 Tax=Acacia crassicarpa TaxID=499986 RepID=A0AAE1N882_9FABA|nr:hypothetical protein QN277_001248 [Acacia crassicarpa]